MSKDDKGILNHYEYNTEDGSFVWKYIEPAARGISIGERAGAIDNRGYEVLSYKGKNHRSHRVAWLACYGEWPTQHIDHINGNKLDNRISNLRVATRSQNMANSRRQKNNKTGFKGVSPFEKKFKAQISKDGKVIYLGLFSSPQAAHEAYCEAAKRLHGEFARVA